MRHPALLAAAYALIVALVLPGSLLASEEVEQVVTETVPETTPTVTETIPTPTETVETVETETAPPVQQLGDEREPAEPVAKAAQSGSVRISDFEFTPAEITIQQGETVTWVNDGPTPHSATASDGSFDTGVFAAGQSRSHTFDAAGSFAYVCTPHPYMRGTVVVQAAQSGGGGEAGGSGSSESGATGDGTTTAQTDDGPALPNSGADAWLLVLLGGSLLGLGFAVHRRFQPSE